MINRPSIALACIFKNEINNVDEFLKSVEGCFDVIHITDTGSTDGTIELLKKYEAEENPAKTPIVLHHFDWCDDFAKARNFSFSHVETDYVLWNDADDRLSDKKAFINWRNSVMKLADYWIATYHYAFLDDKPMCSFARERVFKVNRKFKWKYFIHEGVTPIPQDGKPVYSEYATTWTVNHRRTAEDAKKDRSRNINILEGKLSELDTRLKYYYGKELYENKKPLEAYEVLSKVVKEKDLELHDRIMGLQYACLSLIELNQFAKCIQLAMQGIQLDPQRAEFYTLVGDGYIKLNQITNAIPFYTAAGNCKFIGGSSVVGAIFQNELTYTVYPELRLGEIYYNLHDYKKAREHFEKALTHGINEEAVTFINKINDLEKKVILAPIHKSFQKDHIAITCHPQSLYEWDEGIYETRGIGGSETAVVEMAQNLSKLTGYEVKVFNSVKEVRTYGKVTYYPAIAVPDYFRENLPIANISWRHNIKMTNARNFIWNHDLGFQGLQHSNNYERAFALSNFHKDFMVNFYAVPEDKIYLTKNGINPERFSNLSFNKIPGKVVFSSSPDRGLEKAIEIMDKVVEKIPFATLHIYYGLDNMQKIGKTDEAKNYLKLINSRPYIKYQGNITQTELTKELNTAEVWLYPTSFLETFCITALEMLSAKVYPIIRGEWGAVQDTILSCSGQKSVMVYEKEDFKESLNTYVNHVTEAIEKKLWQTIEVDPKAASWEEVAKEWISDLKLHW